MSTETRRPGKSRSKKSKPTVQNGDNARASLTKRKTEHVEICVDESAYTVETNDNGFGALRMLHRALPEVDERAIDTTARFLGTTVRLPLFISCMTGGSADGGAINKQLAEAAQVAGIAVGMGSIRVLFHAPECFDQFHIKPFAPDVPVIANLSAVQIREMKAKAVAEMLKRLEVQAIALHLNVGQELHQTDGDRDFTGLWDAIARFCAESPVPVIVKETGYGMRPSEAIRLLNAGAAYVDIAGAGGTSWVRVESYRLKTAQSAAARDLDDWGIPTALTLAALKELRPRAAIPEVARQGSRVIASGGIRTGVEIAKAVALGADVAGVALPFIRAVVADGADGVSAVIERLEKGLRSTMTMTGCRNLEQLHSTPLMTNRDFTHALAELLAADDPASGRLPR